MKVGDLISWISYGVRKEGIIIQLLNTGDKPNFAGLSGANYRGSSNQYIDIPAPSKRILIRSKLSNKKGTYIIYYPKLGDLNNLEINGIKENL